MGIKDFARAKGAAGAEAKADGAKIKSSLSRSLPRDDERWAFGFKFFREIKNFGLDSNLVDKKWMISMLARLTELSALTVADVMEAGGPRDGTLRIHDIAWSGKNVPIKRADFTWLDADYLANDAEFPIFQIAVSKAEGRLVGFLDETNVFQIILLDPLHNAQPCDYHDYKVRLSYPLGCEITSIKHKASLASDRSREQGCDCWQHIDAATTWNKRAPGIALVMPMKDDQALVDADYLISDGYVKTYADIFAEGLDVVLARAMTPAPSATLTSSVAAPKAPLVAGSGAELNAGSTPPPQGDAQA